MIVHASTREPKLDTLLRYTFRLVDSFTVQFSVSRFINSNFFSQLIFAQYSLKLALVTYGAIIAERVISYTRSVDSITMYEL